MKQVSRLFAVYTLLVSSMTVYAQEIQSYTDCAECHTQSTRSWKISRHAQSTPATNPFYAAMLHWANESSEGNAQKECERCHVPVTTLTTDPFVIETVSEEGVTCDVCHAVKPSGSWMVPGEKNVKYGPYGDAISVVHESQYSSWLVSSNHCLTCHGNLENAHGVSFCSTELEYKKSSFAGQGVTCQDCHMPSIEGRTAELGKMRRVHSHVFYGGYNPEILQNCADLELTLKSDSSSVHIQVTVTNKTVGHALPTGSPMRAVYLKLEIRDAEANTLWRNFETNPLIEDPQSVFMRLLEDERGAAPVPPWKARAVRFDQRIGPDERRVLNYDLELQNADIVIAELVYRLAPPALLAKLNIDKEPFSEVISIATESVQF